MRYLNAKSNYGGWRALLIVAALGPAACGGEFSPDESATSESPEGPVERGIQGYWDNDATITFKYGGTQANIVISNCGYQCYGDAATWDSKGLNVQGIYLQAPGSGWQWYARVRQWATTIYAHQFEEGAVIHPTWYTKKWGERVGWLYLKKENGVLKERWNL